MDVSVCGAFGLIQRLAPREHHVGAPEQGRFGRFQRGWRVSEGAQFIHAIENDGLSGNVVREGDGHGRVVPEDKRGNVLLGDQFIKKPTLQSNDVGIRRGCSHVRGRNDDAVVEL
jgi:hypothetical protein